MTVYYITKDNCLGSNNYDNVANLESFERELNETYDIWSYEQQEILDIILRIRYRDDYSDCKLPILPKDCDATDEEEFNDAINNNPDNIDAYLHEEDCGDR